MNNVKLNFISGLSREKQKFVITLDIEANKIFCTLDNSIACPETIEVLDSAILNSSTLTNQQFITISKDDLKDYMITCIVKVQTIQIDITFKVIFM